MFAFALGRDRVRKRIPEEEILKERQKQLKRTS
jgi:hypothetical protein